MMKLEGIEELREFGNLKMLNKNDQESVYDLGFTIHNAKS